MEPLITLIDKTIIWENNFRRGIKDFDFDAFNEIDKLIDEKIINVDQNILLIRNFLDFFCDAVKHQFKDIGKEYSVEQAKIDLLLLAEILRKENNLIIPVNLFKKLYKLAL